MSCCCTPKSQETTPNNIDQTAIPRAECGSDPATAGATSEYEGVRYFFCCAECKKAFDQAPATSGRACLPQASQKCTCCTSVRRAGQPRL